VTSVAEHVRERDVETWEEGRGEHVSSLARQLDGSSEAIAVTAVDADHVDLLIDHPILEDVPPLVQPPLDRLVALPGLRRGYLDEKVWSASDVLASEKSRALSFETNRRSGSTTSKFDRITSSGAKKILPIGSFWSHAGDHQRQIAGYPLVPDVW